MIATYEIQDICDLLQGNSYNLHGRSGEVNVTLPFAVCQSLNIQESREMIHVEIYCLTLSSLPRTKWNLM